MPTQSKSLVSKLAEVSKEIGRVPKNGYNAFHKYKYVLESDLVDHIRPLLADRNIFVVPRVAQNYHGSDSGGVFAHENDGEGLTTIIFEYDIIDGDSGEKLTTSAVGYGSDKGDKGAYKASTGAYKYMLMRLFQVATGDDPEGDERTDQRVAARTQPSGWGDSRITESPLAQTPEIGDSAVPGVGLGGKGTNATHLQVREAKLLSRELKLGERGFRDVIEKALGDSLELPDEEVAQSQVLNSYLRDLSAEDIGKLIGVLRTTKEALDASA